MIKINSSIVLYQNNQKILKKAIESFLNTNLKVKLYLIDNSPTDSLRYLLALDDRIEYIFNNKNLGFGKAHNIAIKKSIEDGVDYHLVLNPDVYFGCGVLENLSNFMEINKDVANIMPKVFYPDGKLQYLCKLLPTPKELIFRRFVGSKETIKKINHKYELRDFSYDKILNVPFLSGCFMFLRVEYLKKIGFFDENIFMYMEDLDLNRRLHSKYKTIFYPNVSITHVHAKDSYKNKFLLKKHILSTIYYFNKYGWIFDSFRTEKNKEVIKAINDMNKID